MSEREPLQARCHCGDLVVEVARVSEKRFLCCCEDCQWRSGAPMTVSWYYGPDDVRVTQGAYTTWERVGTTGTRYAFHHCATCGSNVFWTVVGSGNIGVAAGCLPASAHIPPVAVVYAPSRPDWVSLPAGIPWHEKGLSSPVISQGNGGTVS